MWLICSNWLYLPHLPCDKRQNSERSYISWCFACVAMFAPYVMTSSWSDWKKLALGCQAPPIPTTPSGPLPAPCTDSKPNLHHLHKTKSLASRRETLESWFWDFWTLVRIMTIGQKNLSISAKPSIKSLIQTAFAILVMFETYLPGLLHCMYQHTFSNRESEIVRRRFLFPRRKNCGKHREVQAPAAFGRKG